jgi:Cof subfamily protein (haloacid dehalogenase superfamily)
MNVKMIVTDLDGTLLRTDKTISEYTKNILRKCREKGIKIVYATGRGSSAERVAPNEFFDGRITMNGAIGKIDDDIIYSRLIPYQTARPILMECDKHGINVTSEVNGMHYSNFCVTDFWPLLTNFEIVDFSVHSKDAEKIYTPDPSSEQRLFIEKLLPNELYTVVTKDIAGFLMQIMHKDATKAKAVSALAHTWSVAPSEIVAFGDDLNDIDMLTHFGIGVAMGNALDEVKAVADYICDTNENDGIAKWVEERILNGED